MEQAIIDFVRGSDMPLTIGDITESTGAKKSDALRCLREQTVIGNIAYESIQGGPGGQYIWIGSTRRPPMEGLDMDAVGRKPLEPTADELADLPEELLAELELPDSVTAQPENVTIEPKQATNVPKTFTFEPKDMTQAENDVPTPENQANAPAIATPPLSMKISYMITAAKGKIERRKKLEAAQSLARRWANEGHKDVTIHLASEYEHARVTSEVQFRRAL